MKAQQDPSAGAAVETLSAFLGQEPMQTAPADLLRHPKIMQELLDEMPIGVFWKDRDAKFVGANQKMLDYFGLPLEEVVGRRYEELFVGEDPLAVSSGDREIMANGNRVEACVELRDNSEGTLTNVNITKLPIVDDAERVVGVMGFFSDVSEQAQIIADLKTSEMRYALAVRASHDGIWDLDMKRGEFYFSKRCCELLDLPESAKPVPWLVVARKIGVDQVRRIADGIREIRPDPNQMLSLELQVDRPDGSQRWLNLVGAPLETDGELTRIVGALEDVTDDRERENELIYKATHDPLTGLPNRVALTERIEEALVEGQNFALLNIDIDQFRLTNDALGRDSGNHILLALGNRIAECIGPAGIVARSGGDEFAVLLDNGSNAETVAEFLVGVLAQPIEVADLEMFVSATVGVVQRGSGHYLAADVLRDVENALYRAKEIGKGTYCVFSPNMREEAEAELRLQNRIRRAVREMEFELYYQPLFSAVERKMVGVEALIRWRPDGPDGKLVPPNVFLPYLENSGLIITVGRWVIEQACSQLALWRQIDPRMNEVSMSVNVSRAQFQGDQLARYVRESLTRHRIPPPDLSVEVTETLVALSVDELINQLLAIRGLGVKIALDDFGVGHSSLSILYNLPVDVVKIDRSFVDRIRPDKQEPVTEAALEIARSMGLRTVAEGVETVDQASWLSSSGCNVLQGFLLSRPVPHSEVLTYLED